MEDTPTLKNGKISLCACMGPMYGEPHCPCQMDQLRLPKNEAAREEARKHFEEGMKRLFGPGGTYYEVSHPKEGV